MTDRSLGSGIILFDFQDKTTTGPALHVGSWYPSVVYTR